MNLNVDIDTVEIDEMVASGVRAIGRAIEAMAELLAGDSIPAEAPKGATGALSRPWQIREEDPVTFVVFPDDAAYYAYMVARGTRAHGPARARAMRIDDRLVGFVAGRPADEFDVRAIARTESRAAAVLRAALDEEGL